MRDSSPIDIRGSSNMCKHGNFLGTCAKCDEEKKSGLDSQKATSGSDAKTPEEKEAEKAAQGVREFVAGVMPFLDRKKLDSLGDDELIPLLQRYWDSPSSLEHYRDLLLEFSGLPPDTKIEDVNADALIDEENPLHESFLEYLMNKLPIELHARWRDDLDKAADDVARQAVVKRLMKATSKAELGLNLGFHTSSSDLGIIDPDPEDTEKTVRTIAPVFSNDSFQDPKTGEWKEDNSAKTFYSNDKTKLYKDTKRKSLPRFVYVVEASRQDINSPGSYAPKVGAFHTKRALVARHKIPLMPDGKETTAKATMDALGMSFVDFGAH